MRPSDFFEYFALRRHLVAPWSFLRGRKRPGGGPVQDVPLRGGGTLRAVFGMLRRRFPRLDHNEYHLLRSLVYFDDAETEPMPRLIRRVGWREIKAALVAEVRRLA